MMEKKQGFIAILDALGAANYQDEEIIHFLKSRELVLNILERKAKKRRIKLTSTKFKLKHSPSPILFSLLTARQNQRPWTM